MNTFSKSSFVILILMSGLNNNIQAQTADTTVADSLHNKDRVFSQVEVDASFPGGNSAWTKYISKQIQLHVDELKKKDYGTCIVRFIVTKDGHISDVEATTMKKSTLAKIAVDAIENGPKWIPAQQNGKYVNAYRLQPITVTDPGK